MSTDDDWQAWGERDPYFGVLAHERFRREKLTPQALEAFFGIGRQELAEILADCRRHVGELCMRRTLDFGCGVGRMLIPLAELSQSCVGVDVSDAMRAEAARNCARFGRHNVQLVRSLDEIPAAEGGFSFIHCYIVLQHLDAQRGLRLIDSLLARLERGGAAVLHVTYARSKYAYNLGAQPRGRRMVRNLGRPLARLARRLRGGDPEMKMHSYDLNRVLFLVQQQGIAGGGFRLTDHAGNLGAILFLRRPAEPSGR